MHLILKNKPFSAIFITQFLGAFNDNFFRSAFITLITYHLVSYSETAQSLFVSTAFGLFMLPAFLFSPLAGQLADRYDKSLIIRWVKVSEVLIVSISAYGFMVKDPYFLLLTLFFMGAHAAFFGPVKYSILPDVLPESQILNGNGYIEAGTFLAIMLGTLCGALMISLGLPPLLLSGQMLLVAILGLFFSWLIPTIPRRAPHLKIRLSWGKEIKRLSLYARKDARIHRAIISISWFWLVGTVLLSELPSFAKDVIQVEESVFIFLLLLFTLGIGLGSLLCNWLFHSKITTKYVPLLSLLMLPFFCDISSFRSALADSPLSLSAFLTSLAGVRFSADILCLSFVGGLFIVPLYAFIQTHVPPRHRSRIIAYNNIVNAGFMVFASVATFSLLSLGFSLPNLILLTALGQVFITLYTLRILPEEVLKDWVYKTLRFFFNLKVKGLENYDQAGDRVILIANHTSYLDALILAAVLPEKPLFVINRFIAQKWWVKPFLVLAKVFPVDPLYPFALREVIEEAKEGQKILIFPEGRLTSTGSLMKIYEGPGMVAEKAQARILPIRIDGAQYSLFSVRKGQLPRKVFPSIKVTLLPSQNLSIESQLLGRSRRRLLGEKLYDIMVNMMFQTSPVHENLVSSLIKTRKLYGVFTPILDDISRKTLTYGTLFLKIFTLSRLFEKHTSPGNPIGLMLPNSHGLVVSFWALHVTGRLPALLNYTSGPLALLTACQTTQINHVYTSRLFIEKARLQDVIALLKASKIHIHYLDEDVKKLRLFDKVRGIYGLLCPQHAYKGSQNPEDPCVILFTSGSEGTPKGVVLSHTNVQANRYQLASIVDFNQQDRVLNILPVFHAFGLTAGMLLPLLSGIRTFHYVSPLHYRAVAELIYDMNATILFGTDTFLSGYGRVAHRYDFHTLRYVFAGAEKLKETTQTLWFEKFGLRLFEGYGTTETSPVLCVNTPMHSKRGSVGRFLPQISYHLKPVEGIQEGGQLWVKGPNVMKGYLLKNSNGKLIPPPQEGYDTGDIVEVDPEGYVFLKGRLKRFAKVAGETISLSAVEESLSRLWPHHLHAVIAISDPRKGEKLVLFTTHPKVERAALISFWKQEGLSDLSLPKKLYFLPSLPLLGSGKIDYKTLERDEERGGSL